MVKQIGLVGEEGLHFFAKMSASISHELKNVLAIINEHAGLIEDLTLMAEKSGTIDPARLKPVANKIGQQVVRADTIIKNMNRFAHSADTMSCQVSLAGVVSLVVLLSSRLAAMRGITIKSAAGNTTQVLLDTMPFMLENLIWRCLDWAMGYSGDQKELSLDVTETGNWGEIRFTKLENLINGALGFPGPCEQALLDVLNAEISIDAEGGQMQIKLPKKGVSTQA